MSTEEADLLVLGGGPSGQKAALEGARAGLRVMLVDREKAAGGECVQHGTIPSKTLRECAVYLHGLRRRSEGVVDINLPPNLKVASLMRRLRKVLFSYQDVLSEELERNAIERRHGRARFIGADEVEVSEPRGNTYRVRAGFILIATGSRPRRPEGVDVDHEHILDSDSILSLIYLPRSMTVLGGGVIACEFASVFTALDVDVTIVDRYPRPLGFLDPELSDGFLRAFESNGGSFLADRRTASVECDGYEVVTRLEGGEELRTEKLLCAQGRVANVDGLVLGAAGLSLTERGHVPVNEFCQTAVPHIYAAGDVIGPPALAATAMEQGRRAVRHALGLELGAEGSLVPAGIYTIPEIASVGLTEAQARERDGGVSVGRAPFRELARGQISGNTDGLLKLVCDAAGRRILGTQILGEGATELIHVAQMAMIGGLEVDVFFQNVMNFPTLAEAYRVAALDVASHRAGLRPAA